MIQVTICVKDSSFVTYLMSFVGFEHEAQSSRGNLIITLVEKVIAPHSSTLAWKIPWTEEPGRLHSMRSLRVGHD